MDYLILKKCFWAIWFLEQMFYNFQLVLKMYILLFFLSIECDILELFFLLKKLQPSLQERAIHNQI